MNAQLKGITAGILAGIITAVGIAVTASGSEESEQQSSTEALSTLYNVKTEGIRIVLDGKEFTCTDANGEVVNPMIYDGTTYIPVRAVSSAFGKAVYWDGEESTVYLGKMDGKLQKPTATFEDLTNIAENRWNFITEKNIFDNDNDGFYSKAYHYGGTGLSFSGNDCCEYLLNKKYSKFKATLFVEKGSNWSGSEEIIIVGDEEVLGEWEFTKETKPVDIELDIPEVDNFKILFSGYNVNLAHAGFYQ